MPHTHTATAERPRVAELFFVLWMAEQKASKCRKLVDAFQTKLRPIPGVANDPRRPDIAELATEATTMLDGMCRTCLRDCPNNARI